MSNRKSIIFESIHDEIGDSKRESFDRYLYWYENICSDPTEIDAIKISEYLLI